MINQQPRPRPLNVSFSLILITMLAGLAVRFAPFGLPQPISKYGGSMLWALMIYWIISTLTPRTGISLVAAITALITAAIECLKLLHTPWLDSFRLTLAGILLLGRFFSLWDVVAYWLAIALGALIDQALLRRHGTSR